MASHSGTLLHADLNGYPESHRSPPELDCTVWWHRPRHNLSSVFSFSPIRMMVTGVSSAWITRCCSTTCFKALARGSSSTPQRPIQSDKVIWTDQCPPADRSDVDGTAANDRHTSIPTWLSSSGEAMPLSIT